MCNFGACINKAKKPGRKRVKIETMYRRSSRNVKLELLTTSTNFNFCFTAGQFEIYTGQL